MLLFAICYIVKYNFSHVKNCSNLRLRKTGNVKHYKKVRVNEVCSKFHENLQCIGKKINTQQVYKKLFIFGELYFKGQVKEFGSKLSSAMSVQVKSQLIAIYDIHLLTIIIKQTPNLKFSVMFLKSFMYVYINYISMCVSSLADLYSMFLVNI